MKVLIVEDRQRLGQFLPDGDGLEIPPTKSLFKTARGVGYQLM